MSQKYIPLSALPLGQKASVKELTSDGTARRRMLDLGLILGTVVQALLVARRATPLPTISAVR